MVSPCRFESARDYCQYGANPGYFGRCVRVSSSNGASVGEVEQDEYSAYELAKAANRKAEDAKASIESIREETDQLVESLRDELEQTRSELSAMRDQMRLLRHVRQASSLKVEQRVAIGLQTLYNKALRNPNHDRAAIDASAWSDALGGDVDRTLAYKDFERAETLVGDTSVVEYIRENRGAKKNSRLVLRLDNGRLPSSIGGREIGDGGEVVRVSQQGEQV